MIKPALDKRQYKHLILAKNQLQVLLISDPDCDRASAALDVNVGSFDEPNEVPGLAHFLEHMLFLGTERYPNEKQYNEYVAKHGGHTNAFTASTDTNYFFDIGWEHLEGGLELFSQFFTAPLLSKSGVDRELLAVDSEFKKNLQVDACRMMAVEQEIADQSHPFSRFNCGNLITLKEQPVEKGFSVLEKLWEFYRAKYSANLMRLCVLGRDGLETLERWVVEKFSDIPNKNVVPLSVSGHPVHSGIVRDKLWVLRSVKEMRRLVMRFAIKDTSPHWRCKPSHYLSHLIGHESEGSILALLRERGWASGLSAGGLCVPRCYETFSISIDLTGDGLENLDQVISTVYQYIAMLRKEGCQKWIFDELAQMRKIDFTFKENSSPAGYTSHLAMEMQQYPPEYYLYGPYVMEEYQPELIGELLDMLVPEKCAFALVAKSFPKSISAQLDTAQWKKEKWYGAEYCHIPLDEKAITVTHVDPALHLPAPNEFVPTQVSLNKDFVKADSGHWYVSPPRIVFEDEMMRVWFKKDDQFNVPKSNIFLLIKSPVAYLTAYHSVVMKLFVELVKDSLAEYSYMAEMAGLGFAIEVLVEGISICVNGYSQKLPLLLRKILEKIRGLTVDPKRFEMHRDRLERFYSNFATEPVHQVAIYYTTFALQSTLFTHKEKLAEMKNGGGIAIADVENMVKEFSRQVFVEVLCHGDLEKEQVLKELIPICKSSLLETNSPVKSRSLAQHQSLSVRSGIIPVGNHAFVLKVEDPKNPNSAIEYFTFCCEVTEFRKRALLALLRQTMFDDAFNQLRTKEQLGYVVWCSERANSGALGLKIVIMGEYDSVFLESRIENFLLAFAETLKNMKEDEFERHRQAKILQLTEKLQNLPQESTRHWSQIQSGFYEFNAPVTYVDELKNLTKQDLMEFFAEHVDPRSELRRKLSVHVRSQLPPKEIRELSQTSPELAAILLEELKRKHEISLTVPELLHIAGVILALETGGNADSELDTAQIALNIAEKVKLHQREYPHLHEDTSVEAKCALGPDQEPSEHSELKYLQIGSAKLSRDCKIITRQEMAAFKSRLHLAIGAHPLCPLSDFR